MIGIHYLEIVVNGRFFWCFIHHDLGWSAQQSNCNLLRFSPISHHHQGFCEVQVKFDIYIFLHYYFTGQFSVCIHMKCVS